MVKNSLMAQRKFLSYIKKKHCTCIHFNTITKMVSWKSCKSYYLYSSHHIFTCNNTSYILCTFDISGSDAIRLTNLVIHATPSSMPSSMLMSRTCAPFSTCILAMFRASCKNSINPWISLHCKLVIGYIFLLPYESILNQYASSEIPVLLWRRYL